VKRPWKKTAGKEGNWGDKGPTEARAKVVGGVFKSNEAINWWIKGTREGDHKATKNKSQGNTKIMVWWWRRWALVSSSRKSQCKKKTEINRR